MDLTTALSPEAVAVAILVAILTYILLAHRERLQRAIDALSGRRKLRHLLAQHKSSTAAGDDAASPAVSSLYVHPVKSLRPVSVSTSSVGPLGLQGDRCLMIVKPSPQSLPYPDPNRPTHRFVTQRQVACLATIWASLPTTLSAGGDEEGDAEKRTIVRLSIDFGGSEKSVHVDVTPSTIAKYPIKYRAGLWEDVVNVVDVGDEAAQFIRDVITQNEEDELVRKTYGNDVRVVSLLRGETDRPLDERYLPPAAFTSTGGVPRTSLNDGFPVLVACEASLQELNKRLIERGKDPIPMSRFRPNVVIKGTEPFEEDTWKSIWIKGSDDDGGEGSKGLVLHIVKGCPRCRQSCTDQLTGERSSEPLETMATFRALGTSKEDVYFAQNAVPHGKGGTVSVGDTVVVLERGEPVWDIDSVQAE